MDSVMYSSKSNEWRTPQILFDELNQEFCFTLDPASTKENAKCKKFFTKKENGLLQDWSNDVVFCNPPYGKEIGAWVKKAYEEWTKGATVVLLIPARTDTKYWHEYIFDNAEIRFLKGRVKFENENGVALHPAPFPSAVVIFRGDAR